MDKIRKAVSVIHKNFVDTLMEDGQHFPIEDLLATFRGEGLYMMESLVELTVVINGKDGNDHSEDVARSYNAVDFNYRKLRQMGCRPVKTPVYYKNQKAEAHHRGRLQLLTEGLASVNRLKPDLVKLVAAHSDFALFVAQVKTLGCSIELVTSEQCHAELMGEAQSEKITPIKALMKQLSSAS